MSKDTRIRPNIRRLWKTDKAKLVTFFKSLDQETLRLRFGMAVSEQSLRAYIQTIMANDAIVYGAFPDGRLRGIAELRGLLGHWPLTAEIALLVDPEWQDHGIGDALFGRVIAAAQNRGISHLHMLCLRGNVRMTKLAKKHKATLKVDIGDIEATLDPAWPTPTSMFQEFFGDTQSYVNMMFPQVR